MLWIPGPKYLMMPLKTLQSKEIDLQQLPVMSETTLLTTSTVIMVLLNGKMIVHKIEFKIRVLILNKGMLMLINIFPHTCSLYLQIYWLSIGWLTKTVK